MKGKGATTLQLHHAHRPTLFLRRIPRGNTGKRDPLVQLRRTAEESLHLIRGMIRKARRRMDRAKLKALRRQLLELVLLMAERPMETPVGAHDKIAGAMTEARRIYARAPKHEGRRRPKRPPQERRVRVKTRPEDTSVTEEKEQASTKEAPAAPKQAADAAASHEDPAVSEIVRRSREPRPDPIAEAFWASLEAPPNK